jgi:hypothetical protein
MKQVSLPILLILSICCICPNYVNAQTKAPLAQNNKGLIQFSGVVVEMDSLKAVPFTNIFVKNTQHGTVADYFGYFSFVAQKGDTLIFSEIGYARAQFIIPDTLSTNRYSLIQMLHKDTVFLKGINIFAWPTKEQFKKAFLDLHPKEDDLDRARKNLAYNNMRELYNNMPMDGSMNYKYAMDQRFTQLYSSGMYPSYSILNPIAWAQFIDAWKRGDFSNKDQ